jgi:hypothetical protein
MRTTPLWQETIIATRDLLPSESWVATGGVEVKGKGWMQTYTMDVDTGDNRYLPLSSGTVVSHPISTIDSDDDRDPASSCS